MRIISVICASLLVLTMDGPAVAHPADRVYVVNTFPERNAESTFGGSNGQAYQTVGQTIRVPETTTLLRGFAFRLFFDGRIRARAFVYRWDFRGMHAVGAALYRSDPIDITARDWQRVRFDTGRLALRPNRRYVLFLSVAENEPGGAGFGAYSLSGRRSYPHARFVAQSGYGAQSWREAWIQRPDFGDLAFRMRLES